MSQATKSLSQFRISLRLCAGRHEQRIHCIPGRSEQVIASQPPVRLHRRERTSSRATFLAISR